MAWALKTFITFFNHATEVCADGGYSLDPLVITIDKQFSVRHVGKSIDREIVYTSDLETALVLGQAWDKLP
jgi:hypothetical protein